MNIASRSSTRNSYPRNSHPRVPTSIDSQIRNRSPLLLHLFLSFHRLFPYLPLSFLFVQFNKVCTSSSCVNTIMYNLSLELNLTVISARLAQKGAGGKGGGGQGRGQGNNGRGDITPTFYVVCSCVSRAFKTSKRRPRSIYSFSDS